jgi:hypothetical protein
VSCIAISKDPCAKITPVTPPTVNKNRNPVAKKKGVRQTIIPPYIVANQLKIFTPVGIAIIIVLAVK